MPRKNLPLNEKNLEAECEFWKEQLSLQDWRVICSIVRHLESGKSTYALSEICKTRKLAYFSLLDPLDYESTNWDKRVDSWQASLVHELLHLHFHDLGIDWSDEQRKIAAERAIDDLMKALLRGVYGV